MGELERFFEANKTSKIIEAEWTVAGQKIKKGTYPHQWNHMRITLRDKQVFLLHRDDVEKIDNFSSRWEL